MAGEKPPDGRSIEYRRENNILCNFIKNNGKLCNRVHLIDSEFCKWHQAQADKEDKYQVVCDIVIAKEKMGFWRARMGPKLKSLVEEAMNGPAHDVQEEIALTKAALEPLIRTHNGLLELTADAFKGGEQSRNELLAQSGEQVKNAMAHVITMTEKSAKIFALTAEKMDSRTIEGIVQQLVVFVYEAFDNYERHDEPGWEEFDDAMEFYLKRQLMVFDTRINEKLQLPSLKNQGTTITPDQEALLMDSTVPVYTGD
jgi:hypothetical protein